MRNAEGKSRNVSSIPQGGRTDCVHPQKAFWIVKNDRIIDEVNHLGPRDFWEKLKERDPQAWETVRSLIVEPIFRQNKFGEMARKKSIEVGDAHLYLKETMLVGERINRSRNPDKLKSWMQEYVRKYIRSFYTEKELRFVSAQQHFGRAKEGEDWRSGRYIDDPIAGIPDVGQEAKRKDALTFDEKMLIQGKFHKLWKKKPRQAYVLMLKMKERLPTKDIRALCKVSTNQGVDKLFERAKDSMAVALVGKHVVKRPKRRPLHAD